MTSRHSDVLSSALASAGYASESVISESSAPEYAFESAPDWWLADFESFLASTTFGRSPNPPDEIKHWIGTSALSFRSGITFCFA